MRTLSTLFATAAVLSLAACAQDKPAEPQTSEADSFAARINGEQTPPPASVDPDAAPGVAAPQTAQAPAQGYSPGTAADPNSACNANLFAEFIGQQPNAVVRGKIMETATEIAEVRFIAPGSDYIKPDPTHPRLNVMIAVDGIIRDIRCG